MSSLGRWTFPDLRILASLRWQGARKISNASFAKTRSRRLFWEWVITGCLLEPECEEGKQTGKCERRKPSGRGDWEVVSGTMTPQRSVRRENFLSAEGASFFPAVQRG